MIAWKQETQRTPATASLPFSLFFRSSLSPPPLTNMTGEQNDISHIPVIDFSLYQTDPAQCAKLILDAAVNVGFFYLRNTAIERDAVQEMFSMVNSVKEKSLLVGITIYLNEWN